MEQKINIAELLKDCPKGTKLYSPICGECELVEVYTERTEHFIKVKRFINKDWSKEHTFRYDGTVNIDEDCECLLFPSKEVRDWNYFHAKYAKLSSNRDITRRICDKFFGVKPNREDITDSDICVKRNDGKIEFLYDTNSVLYNYILSTGTELKLEEKEEPKFKAGDVIKSDDEYNFRGVIIKVLDKSVYVRCSFGCLTTLDITSIHLATPEEIAKWNEEVLQPKHLHYSKSKRKIIDWFKEFDRVVVRNRCGTWYSRQFDYLLKNAVKYPYQCQNGQGYEECLPYNEKTAKLIGTTNDYKEK